MKGIPRLDQIVEVGVGLAHRTVEDASGKLEEPLSKSRAAFLTLVSGADIGVPGASSSCLPVGEFQQDTSCSFVAFKGMASDQIIHGEKTCSAISQPVRGTWKSAASQPSFGSCGWRLHLPLGALRPYGPLFPINFVGYLDCPCQRRRKHDCDRPGPSLVKTP